MKFIRLLSKFSLCCLMSLMLACGGGGGEPSNVSNPPVISDPPPVVSISSQAASKFLTQTSFGATMTDIDSLSDTGYEAWLTQQFNLPVSYHINYLNKLLEINYIDYVAAWLSNSVNANDQLRQRVAFALSELWVVSIHGVDFPDFESGNKALSSYYDLLLDNAFGNYRDLMQAVTLNPVMGEYLSMKGNEKADPTKNIRPDENYAREMMQLFTIGLHELNLDGSQKLDTQGKPIPTYTQETIEEMARVFTGWHYANVPQLIAGTDDRGDYISPMVAYEDIHDRGQKTVLGGSIIPAEQSAEQDMQQILDIVFNHQNVAPFVCKQLIQRLVTSNPSAAYVERVAQVFNNDGQGVRGDMKSVLRAILLDTEAISGTTSSDKIFGKVKEPLVRMTGIWRTFNAVSGNGEYDLLWFNESLGQMPLAAHHVFNFFSPSYSPQGTFQDNNWVSPEFEIHSEANQTKMTNFFQYLTINLNNKNNDGSNPAMVLLNLDTETELAANLDTLLDHYNLLLFAGEMSPELRSISKAYAETINVDRPDRRAYEILGLLVVSPEFMVQD